VSKAKPIIKLLNDTGLAQSALYLKYYLILTGSKRSVSDSLLLDLYLSMVKCFIYIICPL